MDRVSWDVVLRDDDLARALFAEDRHKPLCRWGALTRAVLTNSYLYALAGTSRRAIYDESPLDGEPLFLTPRLGLWVVSGVFVELVVADVTGLLPESSLELSGTEALEAMGAALTTAASALDDAIDRMSSSTVPSDSPAPSLRFGSAQDAFLGMSGMELRSWSFDAIGAVMQELLGTESARHDSWIRRFAGGVQVVGEPGFGVAVCATMLNPLTLLPPDALLLRDDAALSALGQVAVQVTDAVADAVYAMGEL